MKVKFAAPVFDKVTKDRAAKFVDQLSAIGGTMGLLNHQRTLMQQKGPSGVFETRPKVYRCDREVTPMP